MGELPTNTDAALTFLGADDAPDAPEAAEWPEPQPLVAKVDPEPYPVDALPPEIRDVVAEVSRYIQAPLPMVATCALTAVSIAAQSLVDVSRGSKLNGPSSLFALTIADSGERKSTVDRLFSQAIEAFQREAETAAKPEIERYAADNKVWEARSAGVKEKLKALAKAGQGTAKQESELRDLERDKPKPPAVPRLTYTDSTPEALAHGLAHNWPSAGLVSAEAGSVFGGHAMNSESIMRNLSMLNQIWDGRDMRIDRRKEGGTYTLRGARLTVGLQIQEPTLRAFCDKQGDLARGSGFWARFLIAWPESTQGTRMYREPPLVWPALSTFNSRIEKLLRTEQPLDDDGRLAPPLLALSPSAKVAWVECHDTIERELVSGGELHDVRDVASKTADNVARLAALFHAFDGSSGPISEAHIMAAVRIVAWHLNESRRFFGELAQSAELLGAARLDAWLIERCKRDKAQSVSAREAQQYGPIRDKARLTAALEVLDDLGRARLTIDGRRKDIDLNPALLGVSP